MQRRLLAKAGEKLGVLDENDLAELNSDLAYLDFPEGTRIDLERTGYTITSIAPDATVPYDQEPLLVVSDHPRSSFDVAADVSGVQAARQIEVMMVATVERDPGISRSAVARVSISKVLPHREAVRMSGDASFCTSHGSRLLVSGGVRVEGTLSTNCPGPITIAGNIVVASGIRIEDDEGEGEGGGASYTIETPAGPLPLMTLSRRMLEQGPLPSQMPDYGGRIAVTSALGGRQLSDLFQGPETAGSGECPDFDDACDGRGAYYPSITISKSNTAGDSTFGVACGSAYARAGNPASCLSQVNAAVRYEVYPFAGTAQTRGAREVDGVYWRGLFPDPRREWTCNAMVDDEPIHSLHCDTNPYGYVIDVGALGVVEGGLLSIRRTEAGRSQNNPSGYQEVVILRNADVLYSPLTIHSEIPVYIAGDFNSVSEQPAMIQAPLITLLPANYETQLQERGRWYRVPDGSQYGEPLRPLRQSGQVTINAVLRGRYTPHGEDEEMYHFGAVEGVPQVLGDWSQATLRIHGAIEGTPWKSSESMAYARHHLHLTEAHDGVMVAQPSHRVVEFDDRYLSFNFQPPGSWSPENQPLDDTEGPRSEAEQGNAAGGLAVVHLIQSPTRVPRDSAEALLPPPFCGEGEGAGDCPLLPGTNHIRLNSIVCTPSGSIMVGESLSCTLSVSTGADSLSEFQINWGEGLTQPVVPSGSSGTASHSYTLPGDYTIIARAIDLSGRPSSAVTYRVRVNPEPPTLGSASCRPSVVGPNQPGGNGNPATCTLQAVRGTYPIGRLVIEWGDGDSDEFPGSAGTASERHVYQHAGTYTVRLYAVDRSGVPSAVETVEIRAEHYGPELHGFDCEPEDVVEPEQVLGCSVEMAIGTSTLDSLIMDWGDGTIDRIPLSDEYAFVTHAYHTVAEKKEDDRSYTITARVRDQAGLEEVRTGEIQVNTRLPVVQISPCTPASPHVGEYVECNAPTTASTFPVMHLEMDWQDGTPYTTSPGPNGHFYHSYQDQGTYSVRARAYDARGSVGPWSLPHSIVVKPPAITQLSCSANPNPIFEGGNSQVGIEYDGGELEITHLSYSLRDGSTVLTSGTIYPNQVEGDHYFQTLPLETAKTYPVDVATTNSLGVTYAVEGLCEVSVIPHQVKWNAPFCSATPSSLPMGIGSGSFYCEGGVEETDAVVETRMTLHRPDGSQTDICNFVGTTNPVWSSCGPAPMEIDQIGTYTVEAKFQATRNHADWIEYPDPVQTTYTVEDPAPVAVIWIDTLAGGSGYLDEPLVSSESVLVRATGSIPGSEATITQYEWKWMPARLDDIPYPGSPGYISGPEDIAEHEVSFETYCSDEGDTPKYTIQGWIELTVRNSHELESTERRYVRFKACDLAEGDGGDESG